MKRSGAKNLASEDGCSALTRGHTPKTYKDVTSLFVNFVSARFLHVNTPRLIGFYWQNEVSTLRVEGEHDTINELFGRVSARLIVPRSRVRA